MIHAQVDLRRLWRWGQARNLLYSRSSDDGYLLHKLLTESFGPAAIKPFCLKVSPRGGSASLYGYSLFDKDKLHQKLQEYATPDNKNILSTINDHKLLSKPMPIKWKIGQEIGFEIKTLPIRRDRDENDKIVERDWYTKKHKEQHKERYPVYIEWLVEKLHKSMAVKVTDLQSIRVHSFQQVSLVRSNNRIFTLHETIFLGNFNIINNDSFNYLLRRGIGRHTAFGYGMLLLRPPRT